MTDRYGQTNRQEHLTLLGGGNKVKYHSMSNDVRDILSALKLFLCPEEIRKRSAHTRHFLDTNTWLVQLCQCTKLQPSRQNSIQR